MDNEFSCGMHNWRHDIFCGCNIHGHEQGCRRRFLTKAEETEELKNYAEDLKKELKAVEEKINKLQS